MNSCIIWLGPSSVMTERAGLVEYIIHLTYVGHFETN